jgi:hypothetical protein
MAARIRQTGHERKERTAKQESLHGMYTWLCNLE